MSERSSDGMCRETGPDDGAPRVDRRLSSSAGSGESMRRRREARSSARVFFEARGTTHRAKTLHPLTSANKAGFSFQAMRMKTPKRL
jgi:hypothetical protein